MARFTRLSGEDRRAQLIDVGLTCLSEGGILHFTVDRICQRAGVSRGLVLHHFGSMAGMLAAVYAQLYRDTVPNLVALPAEERLDALIEGIFAPVAFSHDTLAAWLALWGQIAVTPDLQAEHQRQYRLYLVQVADAIAAQAKARGRIVEAQSLAVSLICLIDGLCLQHCMDPKTIGAEAAKRACHDFLAPWLDHSAPT
jgi:TetR/AcrR family transcriptional repressor of bet genes